MVPGKEPVQPEILARHQQVTLAMEIMFVNKIPFFVNINFVTVIGLPNRQVATISSELKKIVRLYRHCGFNVTTIVCNPEFEPLRPDFLYFNTCAAGEHIPEIERMIRTMKERVWSTYATPPF